MSKQVSIQAQVEGFLPQFLFRMTTYRKDSEKVSELQFDLPLQGTKTVRTVTLKGCPGDYLRAILANEQFCFQELHTIVALLDLTCSLLDNFELYFSRSYHNGNFQTNITWMYRGYHIFEYIQDEPGNPDKSSTILLLKHLVSLVEKHIIKEAQ